MADEPQRNSTADLEGLAFVGMDQVPSLYADSFIVASTGEVVQLYFFRNSPPPLTGAELGTTRTRDSTEAQCFARIVVSQGGFIKLLTAMANNAGLVVSKREQEPE
jgi:hypothetical protein